MTHQGTTIDTDHSPLSAALDLIMRGDAALLEAAGLSLGVSATALLLAALIGIPLGAALALGRFWGRGALSVAVNGFMGLPPVVVGLLVYLALSRSGPLGVLGLLFTPAAMIIAQAILITPIIAAYSRDAVSTHNRRVGDLFTSMRVTPLRKLTTLLHEARRDLSTGLLAGFGRGMAEVGAVMIVGGNIEHYTRTMTTAIVLETGKGELGLAVALGLVLIIITMLVTVLAAAISPERRPLWR